MNDFDGFHAHIYYSEESIKTAEKLVEKAKAELPFVDIDTMWKKPVGPHPEWSCQLKTDTLHFPELLYWLVRNRGEPTIFAHVLTGLDLYDHTQGVIWLGKSVELKTAIFAKSSSEPNQKRLS